MQPKKLWSMRRAVFGLGLAQVLVTAAAIGGVMMSFSLVTSWENAVIVGFGLALSSTAFVMQMLGETGQLETPHGEASFAVLLMQDIAIVPLLALVGLFAAGEMSGTDEPSLWLKAIFTFGSIALVLVVGRFGVPFALD
jgi:Kef-type K+ transport system membrane component KefB